MFLLVIAILKTLMELLKTILIILNLKVNAKILAWLLRKAFNISLNIVISSIDYLIFTLLDKRELNLLYNDINLDISLKEFQDINTNLKKYEFILIDKYKEHKFMKIRKNLN